MSALKRHIVESTLVPHTAFSTATMRIEQCMRYSLDSPEPVCLALIGESRTGKSRALEAFYHNHPPKRDEDGVKAPILMVKTPSKPTVKGLVEIMLRALGDPQSYSGTENAKTMRLKLLMRSAKTSMVIIDEFQHFYDKGTHKVMHYVADWLKILVDDTKCALVVAGLPTCKAVLDQNEQLAGRFFAPIVLPRFDWGDIDQREEFVGILGAFHKSISSHFDIPPLDSNEMAFRCYCATGGLIGYLSKLLRHAVWEALDTNKKIITIEDLKIAYEASIWRDEQILSNFDPFSRNFIQAQPNEVLAKVAQIGFPKINLNHSDISRPTNLNPRGIKSLRG
ncbi:TniB family NTP-binding protein [Polynucleobacter sp. AP-Jannik-300A-C4]|uniref:TniB family NTP-binding protein n=1 Tax=Polynucleobacter sp. AP-Jannik-300A-C4 TaxID=2576928 RepID=UPI001BFD491F|nr:TniB family NTP-binding protein [Polynucleobacter sp. AP-Jannik-300A-C4]QWE22984.1 TniB family NTP-binding protein [Polynucleobacter sp. AP-Jannik-300A-C4]